MRFLSPQITPCMNYFVGLFFLVNAFFPHPGTDPDPIQDIRKKYGYINQALNEGKLHEVSLTYDCPDYPEEGSISYFYENDQLRLIKYGSSDGSHGADEWEFYVWEEKLFFAYQSGGYWTFSGSDEEGNPLTEDHLHEYRYYFHNESPIRCLEKQYVQKSGQPNKSAAEIPNVEVECAGPTEADELFSKMRLLEDRSDLIGTCIWEEIDHE